MNTKEVVISKKDIQLLATITKPATAQGIVIFAHGLGSDRFSPRNVKIASYLQHAGFATVLCDLHDKQERNKGDISFDLQKMAQRLEWIIVWLKNQTLYERLQPALFGSSTGAAVAIKVASELEGVIKSLVCRGGRIDLAREYIDTVTAPTLLIVGELDFHLIKIHKKLYDMLNTKKELAIIPGASHLFEEPKKLDEVGKISAEWFTKFLNQSEYHSKDLANKDAE